MTETERIIEQLVRWAIDKGYDTGAPFHAHKKAGVWDNDAGNRAEGIAGKRCSDCAIWNQARRVAKKNGKRQKRKR